MQRTTYTHAQDTGRVLLHVYLKVLVKLFCYGFDKIMVAPINVICMPLLYKELRIQFMEMT